MRSRGRDSGVSRLIDAAMVAPTIRAPAADDLHSLVEHLDRNEVTLVAHSFSGGEAIRYISIATIPSRCLAD